MWLRGVLGIARSLRVASCQPVCSRWSVLASTTTTTTAIHQRSLSSVGLNARFAVVTHARVRLLTDGHARFLPSSATRQSGTSVFVRLLSSSDSDRTFNSLLPKAKTASPFEDPSRTRKKAFTLNESSTAEKPLFSSGKKLSKESPKDDDVTPTIDRSKPISESIPEDRPTSVANEIPKQEADGEAEKFKKVPLEEGRKPSTETTEAEKNGTDGSAGESALHGASMLGGTAGAKPEPKKGFWKKVNAKLGTEIDDNATDAEKRRQRMTRNTKLGGLFLFVYFVIAFVAFCFYYGRPKRDSEGKPIKDEFTGSWFAPFYRIVSSFRSWTEYVTEPSRDLLLPDPLPHPYIQPKYTLVMEMKNVLVSPEWTYKTGHRFVMRPALEYFLDMVGYPNFEVVIYTSESGITGDSVVESFDPKHRIMYKLYRDCTKYMKGHHVKDLSRLNRDMSKVIYIDFDPKSFQLNPENVLRVPKWDGDMNDTSLVDLAELLKTIYLSDVEDVRPTLQYYSQFDDPPKEFRRKAMMLAEQNLAMKQHKADEDHSALKRYSGRLFGYRRHG